MDQKYFKKECPRQPINLPHGSPIPFEAADEHYGYLATTNGYIITELNKLMARGAGGVSEISESEYKVFLEKKSTSTFNLRAPKRRELVGPPTLSHLKPGVAAAVDADTKVTPNGQVATGVAGAQKVEPLKVETEFVIPKVGKVSE